MAEKEQNRTRTIVLVGGTALALYLLLAGRRSPHGGSGGSGDRGWAGAGAAPMPGAQPAPEEVSVWLRGDLLELDGVASDLATMVARARAVGRARVHATGDTLAGRIGTVINALRDAGVTVLAAAPLIDDADYMRARAEATSLRPTGELRNAARRPSALSKRRTAAALEPAPAERSDDPPYAWQRGLDMEESRRIAAAINQAARNDEARREAALRSAKPPPELRARVSVEGNGIIVDTEANTGAANQAWRALRAAKLHIWDTQGSRIVLVGRDSGNHPAVEQVRAKTIDVLRAAGFIVDVDSTSSTPELRNARGKLPRYNERRGMWTGGDSRTLYAFTSLITGHTWVVPGGYVMNWGPEATVRVATRDEAEELWQRPLHPGWAVAASLRNAASEPTHIAILRRVGNERFATKPLYYDSAVLGTSSSVQGAMASAPSKGDLQVRGEYTSDGSHWGIGRGRLVAVRENGRWMLG